MAKTLTLAGVNFLPQLKTASAHIREIIQNKSNVMNCEIVAKSGQSKPQEGSEIVYKDGSRFLFGGFVSMIKPREIGEGSMFIFDVEASDYSYIFGSKIARRAYTNKTLNYIVLDLMSEYVDASYGFDVTNVATGPTIDAITFDHISVRKCFEKLQKLTGYVWYVDYEKKLFFTAQSADPAPEQLTDSTANMMDIAITYDTSQCRNSVIVIGSEDGEQSAAYNEETFVGDGETRAWELEDKPSEIIFMKIDGVVQQYSLDVNERDTDTFVYSFEGASFRLTDAQTTPTGANTIVVRYYPRIPIIVQKKDSASIAFFAALDGGDGVMEYTVKETSITSKATAIDRALQELDEFSMPLVNGQFTTRTGLLSGGSVFSPGQVLTVNLPTHGISSDSAFLIQEVNIDIAEDGTNTEYIYTVRFGGKLVGVQEFLESLVPDGGEVSNQDRILTIEQLTDVEEMEDEAPVHTIFTPPFKYGPSGSPVGRWGLSEWFS
jgi:hypothetical protein